MSHGLESQVIVVRENCSTVSSTVKKRGLGSLLGGNGSRANIAAPARTLVSPRTRTNRRVSWVVVCSRERLGGGVMAGRVVAVGGGEVHQAHGRWDG